MSWRQQEEPPHDWYWPLHPNRQQDHLRVFLCPAEIIAYDDRLAGYKPGRDGWVGALVIDGDYLLRSHPHDSAESAKLEVYCVASLYLGVLAGSLAPQLADPRGITLASPLQRLAARIDAAKRLAQVWKDQEGISARALDELVELVLAMELP